MSFTHLFDDEIDWEGIESARGRVRPDDLPELIAEYRADESDWPRKLAIVQLVQDKRDASLKPIMLDILRAPSVDTWMQDTVELTKVVALGFLSDEHNRFMHYYNDRDALHADVEEFLAQRGMKVEPPIRSEVQAVVIDDDWDDATKLRMAIESGNAEVMRAVLDGGFDLDEPLVNPNHGNLSSTPLIVALMHNRDDLALELIERGADVNKPRPGGQTALWWAASYSSLAVVNALIERGADVNAADQYGSAPIRCAVDNGVEVVRRLLDAGASPDAALSDGRTAAWFAAYEGKREILEEFLERGVPLEDDRGGSTFLSLAAGGNHLELLDALIARGADVNARTAGGLTPLMSAVRQDYVAMVDRLLAAGADPTLKATGRFAGKTALEFASGHREQEIRDVFAQHGHA